MDNVERDLENDGETETISRKDAAASEPVQEPCMQTLPYLLTRASCCQRILREQSLESWYVYGQRSTWGLGFHSRSWRQGRTLVIEKKKKVQHCQAGSVSEVVILSCLGSYKVV